MSYQKTLGVLVSKSLAQGRENPARNADGNGHHNCSQARTNRQQNQLLFIWLDQDSDAEGSEVMKHEGSFNIEPLPLEIWKIARANAKLTLLPLDHRGRLLWQKSEL